MRLVLARASTRKAPQNDPVSLSSSESDPRRAVIFGCAGPRLAAEERRFFAATRPLGFILFERNCNTAKQVRALVESLREALS